MNLEHESKLFSKNHWVLFFQPKKLTKKREEKLLHFISNYPELQEYRDMTLLVGEIYRKEISEIDGHQIDDLQIKSYYSGKLKTAIKTLKKYKNAILRFTKVNRINKKVAKAGRASMEYINNKFKKPFKNGFNRTSIETIKGKLEFQLGCEVKISL